MKKPSLMPLVYILGGFTVIAAIAVKIENHYRPAPHGCNPTWANCEIHAGPEIEIELEKCREDQTDETKDPEVADFDHMV